MRTRAASKIWGDIWRHATPTADESHPGVARTVSRGVVGVLGLLGAATWLWITLSDRLESLSVLEPLFLSGVSPLLNAFLYASVALLLFLLLVLFAIFVVWSESTTPN